MQKPVAILLILAFTFQVCAKLVVAGWFAVNRKQLTELFCINKQKPVNHCNGNCFLSRKLKSADDHPQAGATTPVKVKSVAEEVWFCENNDVFWIPLPACSVCPAAAVNFYAFDAKHSIFQPPRV